MWSFDRVSSKPKWWFYTGWQRIKPEFYTGWPYIELRFYTMMISNQCEILHMMNSLIGLIFYTRLIRTYWRFDCLSSGLSWAFIRVKFMNLTGNLKNKPQINILTNLSLKPNKHSFKDKYSTNRKYLLVNLRYHPFKNKNLT